MVLTALVPAIALVATGTPAHAQSVHSLDAVRAAAASVVQAQLPASRGKYFLTAAALDSRLRLAPCTTALEATPQTAINASARVTVGVRCTAGNQWTVYVPVTVEVELPVLVLQRGLGRDARVAAADVLLQTRRVPGAAANFVSDMAVLQGRHLKRALPSGTPLTLDALIVDVLVRRGQQVMLLARSGSMEIRAQGQAMSDGGINDRIRVQNTNSLKIVEGVIENAGTVRVEL